MSRPSIGAIVVTYFTGPRLCECLYALAANAEIDEIIIADNGNPPEMTAWLKGFAGKVVHARYIAARENIGFGRAVNLGVEQAGSSHVLIINPDCIMRPDAIGPLLSASEGLASPWIVGGRIFDVQGILQRGPMRRDLTLGRVVSKLFGGAGIDMPLLPQPERPIAVDVISGAFFLMERAGFDALGGFDAGYFLHVEDIDLCKRVRLAGGAVVYQPAAGALHFGATSDVSSMFVERHKGAGLARYFRKFSKGPLDRVLCELALPFIRLALLMRAASKRGGR